MPFCTDKHNLFAKAIYLILPAVNYYNSNIMKKLSLLLLLIINSLMAVAGNVEGRVSDSNKQPLEFVNVILYQADGTTMVKGTITDSEGSFVISGIKDGSYKLNVQFMGYKTVVRTITLSDQNNHKVTLRNIVLQEDSEQIEEVAVVAQKQTMKLDIDKKIFNVDQDIASAGGSASEVLENIPSVEVDAEGNISLRGSSSVTVWINGKAQGMTSDNRGDILEQMPAENIDHIEVISNPSSKYSAEGSAGIINIVLKRDRKAGYYGGVQLNASTTGGFRGGANINFSSGIADAYANIGMGRRKHNSGGTTNRDNIDNNGIALSFLNSESDSKMKGLNFFGRAGVTWHITQHNDLSFDYMGMFGSGDRTQNYNYLSADYDGHHSLNYDMERQRKNNAENDMKMNNFSFGYKHEWKTGHDVDLTVSRSSWDMESTTTYDQLSTYQYYIDANKNITYPNVASEQTEYSYQSQSTNINNNNFDIQLDYQQPIGENSKIETGYKGTFFHENTPTETFLDADHTQSIESLFNRFIYDSKAHAIYLNWQSRISEKFGYQLGLRAEKWGIDTESLDYDAEYRDGESIKFSKDYFKLFPTMYLSYHINETQELQLNYTRRLRRPWGGELNSFKNISDSTNISYGNPELTPEYSNSFEFNYIKTWNDHTLSLSAYYRPSTDIIQRISYIDNGIRYQTNENVSKDLSSGLEIIGKNRLFNRLDLTTTLNFFYYKLNGGSFNFTLTDGSIYNVNVANDEDFSWNAKIMASVMLPKEISFQTTFSYDAPKVVTQGKRKASYNLDMGLRKTFFDRRLTLAINGRDLLDSRKWHTKTSGEGFRQDSEMWRGGRRGMIQLSWSFGNMTGKKRMQPEQGGEDDGGNIGGGYGE